VFVGACSSSAHHTLLSAATCPQHRAEQRGQQCVARRTCCCCVERAEGHQQRVQPRAVRGGQQGVALRLQHLCARMDMCVCVCGVPRSAHLPADAHLCCAATRGGPTPHLQQRWQALGAGHHSHL
jgi:hypothetical protein